MAKASTHISAATMMAVSGWAGASLAAPYAAIVVDGRTGETLHADQADALRFPASLTKMMTLYMTFEALAAGTLQVDEAVKVSAFAASRPPSKLGFRAGETISVEDAIKALIIRSANDVASAMGERLGGTEARFATLMTARARALGMKSTRFVNASGLPDPRQVTTARDIATLSAALERDFPQYFDLFSLTSFSFRGVTYSTHNDLVRSYDWVDGIKTGYTRASGFNLATSAERDGVRIVAVVLGGRTAQSRDRQVEQLLNAAYAHLDQRQQLAVSSIQARSSFEQGSAAPTAPPVHANAIVLRGPLRWSNATNPK